MQLIPIEVNGVKMHTFAYGRPMYVHMKSAEELHRWVPGGIEKTADHGSVCSLFCFAMNWAPDFQINKLGDLFHK